ncbi:MAG: hypothetical protein JRN37_04185 [Nitrososphaerota archaeon]|jgi:hypothetical protein|nr:hypothetical protein [Nitrososphaerota archaeon]
MENGKPLIALKLLIFGAAQRFANVFTYLSVFWSILWAPPNPLPAEERRSAGHVKHPDNVLHNPLL